MNNPTIEECAALAKHFKDHFRWYDVPEDRPFLRFHIGDTWIHFVPDVVIGKWVIPYKQEQDGEDAIISDELGLAALTAKCKEVAKPAHLFESIEDFWMCVTFRDQNIVDQQLGFGPTPWTALLATQNTGAASTSI